MLLNPSKTLHGYDDLEGKKDPCVSKVKKSPHQRQYTILLFVKFIYLSTIPHILNGPINVKIFFHV